MVEASIESDTMATKLRSLYATLKMSSTADQQSLCEKFLKKLDSSKPGVTLAQMFDEALKDNARFSNIDQPFLNARSLKDRKPVGPTSRGDNRIVHLLTSGEITVTGGPPEYSFTYVGRQVPPFRQEGLGNPRSGAGGIDYTGRTKVNPVLGEIKVRSDQNSFYAFVQLLTYLSEMATASQIVRANKHDEFGIHLSTSQPFDLHILLTDFNDRGKKGKLIEPTHLLADNFKSQLKDHYKLAAAVVGNVLCLRMDSAAFALSKERTLKCDWAV